MTDLEVFQMAGEACFGGRWKAELQRRLHIPHPQFISQWFNKARKPPADLINQDLLDILIERKEEIDKAIIACQAKIDERQG